MHLHHMYVCWSFAGKSTLLDILAQRKGGNVSGQVLLVLWTVSMIQHSQLCLQPHWCSDNAPYSIWRMIQKLCILTVLVL